MEFFTKEDFKMNSNWGVSITPIEYDGKREFILYISDVYKNPYRVYEYLKQCPIASHKPDSPKSKNGKWFLDGQQYVNNAWDDARAHLFDKIIQFYQLEVDPHTPFPPMSMYNQFRLINDHPGEDKFFCPHTDKRLNCCMYLTPNKSNSFGTTIYSPVKETIKNNLEHEEPWQDTSRYTPQISIMSVFNCMAVFPGHMLHGQTILDNTFKNKTRFTEVAFF